VLGRARVGSAGACPGDIVELVAPADDLVEVYAGDALVARGEAVWVAGRWGVRVRQVLAGEGPAVESPR
jgi:hypothetical protein